MAQSFQAVYENGVLRPLQPLDLEEHELVSLAVVRARSNGPTHTSAEEQQAIRQRSVLLEFGAKMEAIPDETPSDGLSNRDHDRLIYGP